MDKDHWGQQVYLDHCGCPRYRQVWIPNIVIEKFPCERIVEKLITKTVPYEVCRTVYEEVVKQVPVTKIERVPYEVVERVAYQVAKKVPCPPRFAGYPGYGY